MLHLTSVRRSVWTSTCDPQMWAIRSVRESSPHLLRDGIRLRSASACKPWHARKRPIQPTILVSALLASILVCMLSNQSTAPMSKVQANTSKKRVKRDNLCRNKAAMTQIKRPAIVLTDKALTRIEPGLRISSYRANPPASNTSNSTGLLLVCAGKVSRRGHLLKSETCMFGL